MEKTYLYVILLPQMDEELNLGYMIKFGYSKNIKDRIKNGYGQYHRNIKVLHTYKGEFTVDDESRIKQYFRDCGLVLCKDEYLKYCSEVLEFFNTYNTSEKLKNKINTIPYKLKNKYYKVNYHFIEYIISKVYPDLTELLDLQEKRDEIFKTLRKYKEIEQYTYIKEEYGITENELKSYITNIISNPTSKACELVIKFNELKDSRKKLLMLIGLKDIEEITEHDIDSFLGLIQPKYKDYYTIVGPEIIKAYGCEEAKIKKAWREKISNSEIQDNVVSEIYGTFAIGNRYTKSDIKDTLNTLYKKLGYQKKAKATDLELYYYMKPILTSDKKHGFELIGKK